ncbi:MAG: hypothetical protein SGJ02_03950 [bacterium]|nr:hypothetical protein [bacterium]
MEEESTVGSPFIAVAEELDYAGLCWYPEIGDEVSSREDLGHISILVDPNGMSTKELRETYLWLPTVEQLVWQIEARQGILFHAGLEMTKGALNYKTVIQAQLGVIESLGNSLRSSVGIALKELITIERSKVLH